MEMNKKRYIISLSVIVIGLIALVSGTSYAILSGTSQSTHEQIIRAGSVELRLTENYENIDKGMYALPDEDGLLQEEFYEFTISNIGSTSAKYDLKLLNNEAEANKLSDEYIKVGLEVNGKEMGPMSLNKVGNVIDSEVINKGEVIRYKLRLWLDATREDELVGLSDKDAVLSLKVDAKQSEKKIKKMLPGSTVLYNDGTLIINEPTANRETNISAHGAVVQEYADMKAEGTDIEKYIFNSAGDQPWVNERASIKKVEIGQKIYPTSTAYWFSNLTSMESGDLTNIDTLDVTNMSNMFKSAGEDTNVTSFILTGLNTWNTYNVENMKSMFDAVGYYATTFDIGDISGWNTSNVTNMNSMFRATGYTNATTWRVGSLSNWDTSKVVDMGNMFTNACRVANTCDIGDLSNWDTSKVTNMSLMFRAFANTASTFDIGNLSNWDTSKVSDMGGMFYQAGLNATTWSIGNLSNWNTSNVTNMNRMFFNSCKTATTCNIGNLSNWNTSKVSDMGGMFRGFGYSVTTSFDISYVANWDVSNVTNMSEMFSNAGYSATSWSVGNLSNWNTSKVTDMSKMFDTSSYSATSSTSIGTLKIYATNIYRIFRATRMMKATLNIYSNPVSGTEGYDEAFVGSSVITGSLITVNYSSATTNIDNIIATKSSGSNVVKGSLIS